ncbi:chloroplastic import inner membrane translocase subunit HP30-2-like [Bidens hawaiensis]|uniref:chloroplastic import inner membrane translocase subunit HP30-2-like n=1 Tax=Bidens hawaiensis TaxID=980011 RepID=UPI00404AE75C
MVTGKRKQEQLIIIAKDFMKNNPITHFNTKYKEFDNGVKGWLAKQSLPVETAIVTVSYAAYGVYVGGLMGSAWENITAVFPQAMQNSKALAGGPLIQARNFAAIIGVKAGLQCVMKRLTGKDDIQTNMVAAFGSGVTLGLVNGLDGPNVIMSGVLFALLHGGFYKVEDMFKKPSAEDLLYSETKSMLSRLGLQKYEKNFKKGLLTDPTLPLLTDRLNM